MPRGGLAGFAPLAGLFRGLHGVYKRAALEKLARQVHAITG